MHYTGLFNERSETSGWTGRKSANEQAEEGKIKPSEKAIARAIDILLNTHAGRSFVERALSEVYAIDVDPLLAEKDKEIERLKTANVDLNHRWQIVEQENQLLKSNLENSEAQWKRVLEERDAILTDKEQPLKIVNCEIYGIPFDPIKDETMKHQPKQDVRRFGNPSYQDNENLLHSRIHALDYRAMRDADFPYCGFSALGTIWNWSSRRSIRRECCQYHIRCTSKTLDGGRWELNLKKEN